MEFEEIKKYVTPRNYSVVMLSIFLFLLVFNIFNKSYFGFACVGFILGLWLGMWLRWVIIK